MSVPLELFICSANEDQEMLDCLQKHLVLLQRQEKINVRSNTDLQAGTQREKVLHLYLESADIVLLLISPDFMNSDYCYNIAMRRAIERSEQGTTYVIPILLRPVLWHGTPFAHLQMLPTNAQPVTLWPDRDVAFRDIANQLDLIFPEVLLRREQIEREIQPRLPVDKQQVATENCQAPANKSARIGKRDPIPEDVPSDISNGRNTKVKEPPISPIKETLNHPRRGDYEWWRKGRDYINTGDYDEALEAWLMIEHPEDLADVQDNKKKVCNALGKKAKILAYQNAINALNAFGKISQAEQVKQELRDLEYH